MTHTVLPSGKVLIEDGARRGLVEPHDTFTLDALLPDLTTQERQAVIDAWAAIPAEPGPSLDEVKAQARAKVNARKAIREDAGFDVTIGGQTYAVQTRPGDREKIDGQGSWLAAGNPGDYDSAGNADPAGTHLKWTMADNTTVLMTTADFMAKVAGGCRILMRDCHIRGLALKAGVAGAQDAASVVTALSGIETHRATWADDPAAALTGWPKAPAP